MDASPLRLQPPRRGVPTVPSLASLLAVVVAALSTACDSQAPVSPASPSPSPTLTSTASLGTVPGTATPPPLGRGGAPSRKPPRFDHTEVQDAVYSVLARHYQIENVQLVICPPNRPVVRGTTFRCTATIAGEKKSVSIRVTGDKGDYEVGRPE